MSDESGFSTFSDGLSVKEVAIRSTEDVTSIMDTVSQGGSISDLYKKLSGAPDPSEEKNKKRYRVLTLTLTDPSDTRALEDILNNKNINILTFNQNWTPAGHLVAFLVYLEPKK